MRKTIFVMLTLSILQASTALASFLDEYETFENSKQPAYVKASDGRGKFHEEIIVGWGNPQYPHFIFSFQCMDGKGIKDDISTSYYVLHDLVSVKENLSPNPANRGRDISLYYFKDNPENPRSCNQIMWGITKNSQGGIKHISSSGSAYRVIKNPLTGEEILKGNYLEILEFKWLTQDELKNLLEAKKVELQKQNDDKNTQLKKDLESKQLAEAQKIQSRNEAAAKFRTNLKLGDDNHCGLVVEVKKPIVKVQAAIGEKWLKIDQIYPAGSADCRFINGAYQDVH